MRARRVDRGLQPAHLQEPARSRVLNGESATAVASPSLRASGLVRGRRSGTTGDTADVCPQVRGAPSPPPCPAPSVLPDPGHSAHLLPLPSSERPRSFVPGQSGLCPVRRPQGIEGGYLTVGTGTRSLQTQPFLFWSFRHSQERC